MSNEPKTDSDYILKALNTHINKKKKNNDFYNLLKQT